MSSEHEYLTVLETATKARLSPKTLYNWISMGKITRSEGVHHAGRKVVIHWPTFEQLCCKEAVSCVARLENDHSRLLITFQYHGRRCREYLKDTRDNRRAAALMVREIELEMASGRFDYAAHFPSSRNLERLGLRTIESPTASETPTLGDFAAKWLDERRAQLSAATAYDYLTIIRAHILPSALSGKRLDAIDDGDITRLIGELRQKRTKYGTPVSDRRINMVIARLRTIFANRNLTSIR